MAKTKGPPKPNFPKPKPRKRAIIVSNDVDDFCRAVCELGLDPADTWRATTTRQVPNMQTKWAAQGIESVVVAYGPER